jgi:cytochrome c oxidase subunit 2
MISFVMKYFFLLLLISCRGPFSALNPSGDAAVTISDMFWWLLGIAAVIWVLFILLQIYAVVVKPGPHDWKKSRLFIIGGGVLFPLIVITCSVYFSLLPLPKLLSPAPKGSLQIKVSGVQWWWRVKYLVNGNEVELANEIWLPVNEPVQFLLSSEDVIHSFWIPSLGGKMDMIPGRTTQLSFTPQKEGDFLGACAEYCGGSHALMHMNVKVVSRKTFEEWIKNQMKPASPARDEEMLKGEKAFISNGCISCHTVRGISEIGKVGPDLTHIGSRQRIGAGILKTNFQNFKLWVHKTESLKPEVKMPSFEKIPEEERTALAQWLEGLK